MKYSFFKKQLGFYLSLVSLAESVDSVVAKEIYFKPSISIQAEYDDNKMLKTDRFNTIDKSAYGIITRVNAIVGVRSDRYDVAIDNQFILNRYKSDFDLDSDDFNFNLSSDYQLTEKHQFGLSASFKRDTTLTSELGDLGLGTGLVQDNVMHEQWSIAPTWSYSLSNTEFIQASYEHSEHMYAESKLNSFADYTIDMFSTSFTQQWTPLWSNFLSFSAMSFKIPERGEGIFETDTETTEYSIYIGSQYQLSPTWSASVTVGERFTTTEITFQQPNFNTLTFDKVTTSTDVQGFVFSFDLDKQFEVGNANISYSRSTNPQGRGQLEVRDTVNANFNHRFTQKLNLSLNSSFNKITISGREDDNNGRTYFDIRPTIRWSFDKQLNLTAGYRYRAQSYERDDEEAVSNSVTLNFNYRWDKVSTQQY